MEIWVYHTEFVIMMVRTEREISLCMAAGYIMISLTRLVIVVRVELSDQSRSNGHFDK